MKKRKKILIGISIVVILLLTTVFVICFKNNGSLKLKETSFTFELGEEIPFNTKYYLSDSTKSNVLKNSSITLKNNYDTEIIDGKIISSGREYLTVGSYEVVIKYKKKDVSFEIKVEDTTPPSFEDFQKEITIQKDAIDVDLTKYFKAKDISGTPNITVDSNLDISKVGEYEANVKAVDYYNNVTTEKAIIKVVNMNEISINDLTKTIDGSTYKSKESTIKETQEKVKSSVSNQTKKTEVSNSTPVQESNNTVNNSCHYRTDVSNTYVAQINAYRVSNGLPELPVTSEAQNEANKRAVEIVTNYAHNSSYGFGENIGDGSIGSDFFTAWKNSPIHNSAMLREQNTAFAVSVYECNNYWYAVTSFKMNY